MQVSLPLLSEEVNLSFINEKGYPRTGSLCFVFSSKAIRRFIPATFILSVKIFVYRMGDCLIFLKNPLYCIINRKIDANNYDTWLKYCIIFAIIDANGGYYEAI